MLCNSEEDLDAIFSATCISNLNTAGRKPVLPPDLKAKRSVILRRCDYQILNKKEEDIKFEIEKQNAYIRVRDIFNYDSSKNIKVTFENQHMVSQVLTKGLVLFNLSHPAHNISRKFFVDILTCFKCYQLEDHPTSSCPKSKEYKICSLCDSQEHTHREFISSIRKCINCKEEGNDHSTLAMSCSFRKNVSKKKREEIMHNTNNRHLNNSHQSIQSYPAHSYSHVLAHSNSPGHSTSVTSVNSPPGYTNPIPSSITFTIHPISAFEKAAIQMQLSAYLSPQSKAMRFRAPLKRF